MLCLTHGQLCVCVGVIVYMCVCLCHANEAINKNFKFNLDSLLDDDGSSFALAARLHLLPFARLFPLPPYCATPLLYVCVFVFHFNSCFLFCHTHTHSHTLADTHTRGYNLISHALLALNFALASCSHFKLCRL